MLVIKKKLLLLLTPILTFIILSLCCCNSVSDYDTKKINDIEYEIIEPAYLPEDVRALFDSSYTLNKRLIYSDTKYPISYILICYGEMPNSGYTISIDNAYESTTNIFISTTLIGPERKPDNIHSYPSVVLKVRNPENKKIICN